MGGTDRRHRPAGKATIADRTDAARRIGCRYGPFAPGALLIRANMSGLGDVGHLPRCVAITRLGTAGLADVATRTAPAVTPIPQSARDPVAAPQGAPDPRAPRRSILPAGQDRESALHRPNRTGRIAADPPAAAP